MSARLSKVRNRLTFIGYPFTATEEEEVQENGELMTHHDGELMTHHDGELMTTHTMTASS
jgi:hypothetical protein